MFGTFDHVGVLVRDLDAAVERARSQLGLEVARTVAVERMSVRGTFLGEGTGTLELFTFDDEALLAPRLGGAEECVDHVAFRVDDLDSLMATLRAGGVRFCGPDRVEIDAPLDSGPARSVWTLPETSGGVSYQLTQPSAQ